MFEFDTLYLPTTQLDTGFVKLATEHQEVQPAQDGLETKSGEQLAQVLTRATIFTNSQSESNSVQPQGKVSFELEKPVQTGDSGTPASQPNLLRVRFNRGKNATAENGTDAFLCEYVWIGLYWCFQYTNGEVPIVGKGKPIPDRLVELDIVSDALESCTPLLSRLEKLGLLEIEIREGKPAYLVYATTFWQAAPELFISRYNPHSYLHPKPLRYIISNNAVRHPKRPLPPPPKAAFYSRHCISDKLNSIFRLRPVDMSDLDLMHKWMNNPRVAEFWGEQGPIEHQKKFLETCLSSQHSFTAIGSWNDLDSEGNLTGWRDACFFDIYWVKEDRLARYANNIQDWDRGVHLLVGEDWARGRSKAWLDSIVHCKF
ncbi:hypothetical protein ABW19_dt0206369 [Dactylella cylindrospora]|nr:hypothetical protein ABW19_dt0206369 [Dactylella cylindrospora]